MARSIEDIQRELLELDLRERATLAKFLLESLEKLPQEDLDRLWVEEAEARYADLLAGRTSAIDGDEVFARARSRKW
ncbi:MAG: addiction module protein [Acidobacteriota bacterium]|nr:addiction module protein [Acidobacteriota bacterium]